MFGTWECDLGVYSEDTSVQNLRLNQDRPEVPRNRKQGAKIGIPFLPGFLASV